MTPTRPDERLPRAPQPERIGWVMTAVIGLSLLGGLLLKLFGGG